VILRRTGELAIEVDEHGWVARFPGAPVPPAGWPGSWLKSSQDWQLAWQLNHLIELGIAAPESNTFRVPYSSFSSLLQQGFTLPLLWSAWSPLSLDVTMHGRPGEPGCCFSVRWFLGDLEVAADRCGRYVQRNGHPDTWLLDEPTWHVLERISRTATGETRQAICSWAETAFIRDLCQEACVTMHGFLADHEIIFPVTLMPEENALALAPGSTLQIQELSPDVFRRVMRGWSGESTFSFAGRERWIDICFDDLQLGTLNQWRAGGAFHSPEKSPVNSFAGRLGYRTAVLRGQQTIIPVRLFPPADSDSRETVAPNHLTGVNGSSVRYFTAPRIQAAIGCYFEARGYEVILTSEGCRTGIAVLAIRDGSVLAVRIESPPFGDRLLQNAIRSVAALRQLVMLPYEFLIILLATVPADLKYRAEQQGIEIRDIHHLSDMIDSEQVTEHAIAAVARNRSRSTGDTVYRLKTALDKVPANL